MCNRLDGFKSSYYIHDSTELITIRQGKFKNMTAIHIRMNISHKSFGSLQRVDIFVSSEYPRARDLRLCAIHLQLN